jgi:cathepsin B
MSIKTDKTHPLHTFVHNPTDAQETIPDIEKNFQYTDLLKDYYPCSVKYPKKLYKNIPKVWEPHVGIWKDLLVPVTDQGSCGSCWAFSVCNTLSDRYNIWCREKILPKNLSPFLILSCNLFATFLKTQKLVKNIDFQTWNKENGCYGNILLGSILYIYFFGIPTSDCFPYDEENILRFQQEKTNFSFFSPTNSNINLKNNTFDLKDFQSVKLTPSCAYATNSQSPPFYYCMDNIVVDKRKLYGSIVQNFSITHFYSIENDEKQIQLEILANGPVVSGFIVYQDYYIFDPKKDIYIHDEKKYPTITGGHAIEIVGWGEENGVKFWWIKNTWGTDYGINGYFRFLRGKNMCHIESNVHGFFPDMFMNYFDFKKVRMYNRLIQKTKYVENTIRPKLVNITFDVLLYTRTTQQSYYKKIQSNIEKSLNLESYYKNYGSFGFPVYLRTNYLLLIYTNNFLGLKPLYNTSLLTNMVPPELPTKAYRKTLYANFKRNQDKNKTILQLLIPLVCIFLIIVFWIAYRKSKN